jgi:hypothetical protein
MRTCNMFDLDMTVDISVDYHYDPYDKIIELTSVKWGDVEILDMISDKVYDDIVEYISDEDLWRIEEAC